MLVKLRRINPATVIGSGSIMRLKQLARTAKPTKVILASNMRAAQQRRLEAEIDIEVADRTGLILDIFAQRASSAEGKLQVELARCEYDYTRLTGTWDHLERQRGSLKAVGGPGEKQLEIDRRLLARKIRSLRTQIARRARRTEQAVSRRRARIATIALVGYTNAGKTSLFARLTRKQISASARLFDTLDTTTRRVYLGDGTSATLSDTVGFLQDLPHSLIDAFRTTLREAVDADLIVIVADSADKQASAKLAVVEDTLKEIGVGAAARILVANKADLLRAGDDALVQLAGRDIASTICVSAKTGQGLAQLRMKMLEHLSSRSDLG